MSLAIENVSLRWPGPSHGLDHINLEAARGELLAVIGHSGSGKSTLLRLCAGLHDGYTGRIAIDGADMAGVPVWRRQVGMVFQNYALFPQLDVLGNVAYGLKMRGASAPVRQRLALEMLELVGLSPFAQRNVSTLSGGQQQRVALARALVIEPRLLLLDEPLAALDASVRTRLRDEIRALQRSFGATTLMVTHDQDEALSLADRVAMIDGGRVLQVDTPAALYERPVSSRVARFVGQSTILRGFVTQPGRVDVRFASLCADTDSHRVGDTVDVLVRPENVRPDPPPGATNWIAGQPGELRYFGSHWLYDFKPERASAPILCAGRQLPAQAIAIEPRHLRVLPAAAEAET